MAARFIEGHSEAAYKLAKFTTEKVSKNGIFKYLTAQVIQDKKSEQIKFKM